ncbi:MAG: hypothetical protein MZW92_69195 [Comamonadaceae bacterium]|nr:hypothetical protein [Comamonadaceae bacterium]
MSYAILAQHDRPGAGRRLHPQALSPAGGAAPCRSTRARRLGAAARSRVPPAALAPLLRGLRQPRARVAASRTQLTVASSPETAARVLAPVEGGLLEGTRRWLADPRPADRLGRPRLPEGAPRDRRRARGAVSAEESCRCLCVNLSNT